MGAKLLKILQRVAKFKEFLRKKAFKGEKVKKPPMRDAPGALVGYRSSIPLLLTCVFTSLRCALYFTIFQCSFLFHNLKFLKG
ncbi:hypothetical protein PREVCOP_06413 [Segatella copri DSM 18205]|uniref:Uncharacterized protein n=1 Tax=Segatella copri DSM 18205 TaxID=537011 RepID=D1PGQ0_9BACT|nr:hypothetical protein PREVCOP_06413 [Segatella copri DSM 18205]